ncbi:pilus (MSHA type) biogenesis protein MshL [Ferrimonas pelagia]|uniref:Pilus (MSHA type) biogenesis protein MshL n=1 Tax=Ferrimonas pelagia TaxID=1177826 RepID=A0ABP9FHM6_9GAMM
MGLNRGSWALGGLLGSLLVLGGCQNLPKDRPEPVSSQQALQQALSNPESALPPPLPDSVQAALRQPLAPAAVEPQGPMLDVAANGVDAQQFFAGLVKDSPYNIAVHPGVQGTISLNLRRVTLDDVLTTVRDIYGYDVRRQGQVLQIFPAGLRSETFPVDYLLMQRNGVSLTTVSSGRISDQDQNGGSSNRSSSESSGSMDSGGYSGSRSQQSGLSNGTFIETRTETHFWDQLETMLTGMIGQGDGRSVLALPQAGLVSVKAYPDELRQVEQFLQRAQKNLSRQVILEARILEVKLDDGYQQGINWSEVTGSIGNAGRVGVEFGTSAGSFGNEISQALGGLTGLSFSGTDFNAVVTLLDTQGDVDTLSSPRVTALNNQKAVIKVGTDEYFVTDISSTTVASTTPVTSPDVELTPFFSGIALDVTPQIGESGDVLLHVHPSVTDITEQTKVITALDTELSLPLAQSEIRESDTLVRARSGDVVVIGGMMKTLNQQLESRVPVLGQIPLLGELFTNRSNRTSKTELVILLRPVIVEPDTWQQQLQRSANTLDDWYSTEATH